MDILSVLKSDCASFDLTPSDLSILDERTVLVKNWNWDYPMAHKFQKLCVQHLQNFPRTRILICCSHPRVLTNGRGLQRPKKGEVLDLKEFNKENYPHIPYPFHKIERGGGLTFHHPGQFVFYPILKLNPTNLSLSKMLNDIFQSATQVLTEHGVENLSHENKLMGLWHNNRKIASMGIAIEKLTTYHGMALNLYNDSEMMNALSIFNPCGMSTNVYISAEEILGNKSVGLESFTDLFIGRISHAWK